jgi:hypothetical protein
MNCGLFRPEILAMQNPAVQTLASDRQMRYACAGTRGLRIVQAARFNDDRFEAQVSRHHMAVSDQDSYHAHSATRPEYGGRSV